MSLRSRLLLVSLLMLALPWAGCQYAREMEVALRSGQEQAMLSTADAIARVIGAQVELLYRSPELAASFDRSSGDVFASQLPSAPILDADADDWAGAAAMTRSERGAVRLLAYGIHGSSLYTYLEIARSQARSLREAGERVVVLTRRQGVETAWCAGTEAPGAILASPCLPAAPWTPQLSAGPAIRGSWAERAAGFAVELRIPLELIGERIAMFAVDSSGRPLGGRPLLGRLHAASPALRTRLMRYAPEGARISVVDRQGYLLARSGAIDAVPRGHLFRVADNDRPLADLYRAILGRTEARDTLSGAPIGLWGAPLDAARAGQPSALWVEASSDDSALVRAAVPIAAESGLLGAVMVEQAGDRLLLVRDTALVRLFNLTLLATGLAVLSMVGFSAWLARRLRRLSRAAAGAMTPEGRIEVRIPETGSADEVGELARSFKTLLSRLTEHTDYLRTLGSKLSHELRTPLAVVSSSLDNLQHEELTGEAPVYLNRARDGASRLHRLLTALSEASRVEQSIEQAERARFDLRELVHSVATAYAQTCGDARLRVSLPSEPCPMQGAPELIAQMLDKLVENAIDFCTPGGAIDIGLERQDGKLRLSVANEGPTLPAGLAEHVFESLVSNRPQKGDRPHLGLGLYIVRLIADFHGGRVGAVNLPDNRGVMFWADFPEPSRFV